MSKSKDIAIIESLKKDASGSYALLYRDYYGMIRHLVTRNNGSLEDSSDVFQDSIIGLFELIQKKDFVLSSSLSTLIYSLARNIWYKKLRLHKREDSFVDFERYIEVFEQEGEEESLYTEQMIEGVERNIHDLGDPCKTILIDFYYLKKRMKEIAEKLKYKTTDHVKSQKYKCLQRLRKIVVR